MFTSLEKFDIYGNEFGSLRWIVGEEIRLWLVCWMSEEMDEVKDGLLGN